MSQVPEEKKTSGVVKYHELKRPLTKAEKRAIRRDPRSEIDDSNLFDKFATSIMVLLCAGTSMAALGIGGIGIAAMAETPIRAAVSGLIGAFGCSAAAVIVGKFGFDAFRYFFDRHKRIHALEQAKIQENTQRDSQELQEVREAKMAEAEMLQARCYERQTPVVERRKKELALRETLAQASKPKNASKAKKQAPIRKRQRQPGD